MLYAMNGNRNSTGKLEWKIYQTENEFNMNWKIGFINKVLALRLFQTPFKSLIDA